MLEQSKEKISKEILYPPNKISVAARAKSEKIHPSAIIQPQAELGDDVEIGAYSVIGSQVKLGAGVKVAERVSIDGLTEIGQDTRIWPGAVVGMEPQDKSYKGANSKLIIGPRTKIREYASIHKANLEGYATVIGADVLLMGWTHIGHDCQVSDGVVICNASLLAGHVHVHRQAFLSANVMVHQFSRIGRLAMISGGARVTKDVPPFCLVAGNAQVFGLNKVGIQRAGITKESAAEIREIYRVFYRAGLPMQEAIEKISTLATSPEGLEVLEFLKSPSKRGYCWMKRRQRKQSLSE